MLRLMIADDEQIIRETLTRMIDYPSIGYQLIATAKNGMEAYDMICDEYPDVVITDIRMPGLNGLDLIARATKADSDITFILLSGYGEFEYAKTAMEYGVRHYLLKPTNRQELLKTLIAVRDEKLEKQKQGSHMEQLLCDLHSPLEQCFIIESLEYTSSQHDIFQKYQPLLSLPASCTAACVCSFVKEELLEAFAKDTARFLKENNFSLSFPVLYVKNNAILIFSSWNLEFQDIFQLFLERLEYPGQEVALEARFLHASSTEELFSDIIRKVSRFERIRLLNEAGGSYEIHNDVASVKRIRQIGDQISQCCEEEEVNKILSASFSQDISLDTARSLALGIFLESGSRSQHRSIDLLCDFFRKLYSCENKQEIQTLIRSALLKRTMENQRGGKTGANIPLLKAYVAQHLDWEELSLKWLAEHYLFVSVGYLSKQFVKEEGIRFSDYLNQKRMEEAERLMVYYHNDNIKSIAHQVGFGSNPQYFSQVFKKYTGQTPTEYLKKLSQTEKPKREE